MNVFKTAVFLLIFMASFSAPAVEIPEFMSSNASSPTAYIRVGQGDETVLHKDEVVFLLHGIARSVEDMSTLQHTFQRHGYDTVNWDYPSTKYDINELAESLYEQVKSASIGKREIHFVAHSMGGVVVRTMLFRHAAQLPRVGCVVMIGTPNHGAHMADVFSSFSVYRRLLGPAGSQLRTDDCSTSTLPYAKIGIIAGGIGMYPGLNPLIPEDNDGVVGVSETTLPEMHDFLRLPYLHRILPRNRHTAEAAVNFVENGRFLKQGSDEKEKESSEE